MIQTEMRDERFYVPYQGPSTNAIYAGKHWISRKRDKDAAREVVVGSVQAPLFELPVALHFVPVIGRGARFRDLSNYTYAIKLIEDGLVHVGALSDDTVDYVRSIRIYAPVIDRTQEPGFVVRIVECQGDAPAWAEETLR